MLGRGSHFGVRRCILLVLTIFILLGYMYACVHNFQLPDFVKPVYAQAPEYDYVDQLSNVDGITDVGTHSSFDNEKAFDSTYDTLTEENVPVTSNNLEDYVDSIYSNVYGTHSDFTKQQLADSQYDTLTEASDGVGTSNYPISNMNFTSDSNGWTYSETDAKGYCYSDGWQSSGGNTGGSGGGMHRVAYNDTSSTQPSQSVTDIMAIRYTFTTPATSLLSKTASFAWKYTLVSGSYTTQTLTINCYLLDTSDNILETLYSTTTMQTTWQYQTNIAITYALVASTQYKIGLRFTIVNGGSGNKADIFRIYIEWDDAGVNLKTYNYRLDLQEQWTSADFDETSEYLCIKTGTLNGENLRVDVYNGAWNTVISALTASQWNNVSVSTYLTSSTFIMRFIDTTQASDTAQSTWQIDATLLHTYTVTGNYRLDLEEQFTDAEYSRTYEELCIYMGTTDAEDIRVYVWITSNSSWVLLFNDLTANSWNNISVTSYLDSATFTIKFVDGTQSSDSVQSSWQKDCALLHTWSIGYNLNLRVRDWDLTDSISGALVYKDTDILTSNGDGWANWTLVTGTVAVKVEYFGFWVNGTFSVIMDSDKTIDIQCKLYDVTVTVQENAQSAYLVNANVSVYNASSTYENRIKTGITGDNGQVALTNLPNNTLTFTQYGKSDWSLVIGNTTQLVDTENQSITLTSNQNNLSIQDSRGLIGVVVGFTIPLKGYPIKRYLKRKISRKRGENIGKNKSKKEKNIRW